MAILASYGFKTLPGRFSRHIAISLEARDRLQKMGFRAGVLRQALGDEPGTIATVISYANAKSWAEGTKKVNTDPDWMAWYAKVADEGVADATATEFYSDVDPNFVQAPYGAMKVFRNTQWRALPGKAAGLIENINASLPHIKRLGGTPRVTQCFEGVHPMTLVVSVGFESLVAAGAHMDAVNTDPAFQSYWASVMSNPTAQLVRTMTAELLD